MDGTPWSIQMKSIELHEPKVRLLTGRTVSLNFSSGLAIMTMRQNRKYFSSLPLFHEKFKVGLQKTEINVCSSKWTSGEDRLFYEN